MQLREQIHAQVKLLGYSPKTETTYWHWIEQYLRFSKIDKRLQLSG